MLRGEPADVGSVAEARRIQESLRGRVLTAWDGRQVSVVAGVDVALHGESGRAAVVVLSYPGLGLLEWACAERPLTFPYVPGYLAFREAPVAVDAVSRLRTPPDVYMIDGQGIAHPRRMGIAAHIGVLLDAPTIGCAKSRLFGDHGEVGEERGQRTPLTDPSTGEVVGSVLRTRTGVSPVFVSIGHRVDLETSMGLVLGCARYRIPEPLRLAHILASHGEEKLRSTALRDRRV